MSDLDLGMNTWMSQPFPYPDKPLDRGKVLDEAKVKELGATWGRYKDVDGDGIPWRSLPGTPAPAFFTRGSGHNEMAQYSERADDYLKNLDRLSRKFDTAKTLVPPAVIETDPGATVGVIAYGSSQLAVQEARDQLREEAGLETAYLRLRAYPFGPEVEAFVRRFDRVYVVEQNRDAQMLSLLRLDLDPALSTRLQSVLHYDGLPIDARSISDSVRAEAGPVATRAPEYMGTRGTD
jgi:2-oxoglutarate/2-oxoacid ferredoxin oxidoreductase subunit alpha